MSRQLQLSEVIRQLREELSKAIHEGADEDLRFELASVELELAVTIEITGEASGKVRFMVLDGGASAKRSSGTTQQIRLVLDPHRVTAPNERVSIAGKTISGER
ncbi:hypothetical protein GCM10023196_085270 [Actinoallomurus vinaceus]|uniref:Trypsin-co-occurring domain-containing protein n=1 Tax=Actinoallomurus vinaceus TaxID=1080074 RepID=A0ABP8UNV8_9ACTN